MVFLCGVLTLLACVAIDLIRGHEVLAEFHDEQAYVLAGDTFAHGRLTNPAHPLARSLDMFHVLQEPTYQARYPPGQGLFLALGMAVGGRALEGVWISAALYVAALCWMLQAWFPPRWAVIGAVLGAATMVVGGMPLEGFKPGYWSQSYWGGAGAALGGALLLGGIRRVFKEPRWTAGAAMGAGASILALTRPFEGLLLAVPVAAACAVWLFRSGRVGFGRKILHVVLPGLCIAAAGLGWLLYYNWRVTGGALLVPHTLYARQHPYLQVWAWQRPAEIPPDLDRHMFDFARVLAGEAALLAPPLARLWLFYRTLAFEAGQLLAPLLLLMLPWTVGRRWIAFAAGTAAFVMAGMFLPAYLKFHYHAPAAPLTIILAVAAVRRLALLRGRFEVTGRALAALLIGLTILNTGLQWIGNARRGPLVLEHWMSSRQSVIDRLTESGGRHVVFVRYGPNHSPHIELVFNGADIDGSPIVWVRELDAAQNAKVVSYFHNRTAWLMTIDNDQGVAKVEPWPSSPQVPSPNP
jgi:hypothetical protein